MSLTIVIILILMGLLLLIVELLIIPGTTVVGIVGFIVMSVGIWQAFVGYGVVTGTIVLVLTLLISALALYLSLRSNTWKKAMLHSSIESKVNTQAEKISVGDTGITISRLNPMGKASFNNEFFEVSSYGEFIDANTKIQVIDVVGNKIIVEKEL